ncbi:MAG TPA: zinc-dependent metalloprotease family protein [Chitinophagaceae bacterium]|nr:zinc-dependent metalloprotease family protein [Chitinophagaceae bacterium]
MRRTLSTALAVLLCIAVAAQDGNFWTQVNESRINKDLFANRFKPAAYKIFQLNEAALSNALRSVPSEKNVAAAASDFILHIPNENGQLERFRVVAAPVMHPDLAAKYPGINSYAGQGIDDPTSTIRFDVSPRGFHGMVLSTSRKTIYIDAIDRNDQYYVVFSRKDIGNYQSAFQCLTEDANLQAQQAIQNEALKNADDARLRTYRLALAASGEYSTYFLNGTETSDAQRKAKVLAAMNTAMTRTNGIYERDFGIRMVLIANNDAIIYLNASTDPWTNNFNSTTQTTIDNVIGNANYDIGHLVHRTSNNGNAGCIGCVCKTGQKGSAFTSHTTPEGDPFVVDYLTHEMGHQFGGNHTFAHSYEGTIAQCEPGSGSTIMGYAGITGSTTDVQPHSDDYFHARSIEQITNYIKSGTGGGACAVVTLTGNNTPTASAGADFTIPKSTPFTLTGTGTDADVSEVLTYGWEQIDARTSSSPTIPSATATAGPVFRSFTPTTSNSRTFPALASILNGTNTNKWEVLPSVQRTLNFRFTVKDNRAGGGNNKSDEMIVTVSSVAGPFAVTAPNTAVSWAVGTSQTVTWSVNSTNVAPVNCTNVAILLSVDGGNTFPITLAASTPNDGSENVTVPNNPSALCRIKVAAVGNIFFDISNTNFTIGGTPPACSSPTGLATSSITSSSATVSWSAVSGANSYDVDYKASAVSTWTNAASGTTATSVNLSGLSASTAYDWRVRANCSSGSSTYATGQFITNPIGGGCTTNFEPNESLAAAATVATNTTHSAGITTTTDKDWFAFTLSGTNNLNITLSNLPADYDIILYNSAGTEIRRSENAGTTSESIVNNNTAAGTYYIQVFGYNGANSTTVCYNLNIGATPVTTPTCPSTYDVSTNGTLGGAALVPFNTDIKGLISPSGDVDYYRFVITNGGTITITLTTLPADYDLRLYNSSGNVLQRSENGGTTSETISRNVPAGTYYARVVGWSGANSSTVCYTLRVALGTASREEDLIVDNQKAKVQVFPNPSPGNLQVIIPGNQDKAEISIQDMYGRTIMRQNSNAISTRMNISTLPSGVYVVKVNRNGKEIFSTKIVKE